MRPLKMVGAVGVATAVASVMVAGVALANGPTYAYQSGTRTVEKCINRTYGGTAAGGSIHGQFAAGSEGGGGCNRTYLELVYVDNSGNEVAQYAESDLFQGSEMCGAECVQIIKPTSSYRSILEVIGSSQASLTGDSTGGTYLYFF